MVGSLGEVESSMVSLMDNFSPKVKKPDSFRAIAEILSVSTEFGSRREQ